MKSLAVVLASFPLLGCYVDQEQQAAKCKFEAQKTYPDLENMYLSPRAATLIELCMATAGYDFDYDNRSCASPDGLVSEKSDPYCYVPRNRLDRLSQAIENRLARRKRISN